MRGRTHLATGWAAWTAAEALAGPPHLARLAVGGLLAGAGALLPDLDQVGSTAARSLGWLSTACAYLVRGVSGGHRHATHSLLAVAVTAAASQAGSAALLAWVFHVKHVPWWPGLALTLGVAVHIAGDMLTRSGCPLLWPSLRRFWLLPARLRVSTGGRREYAGGQLVHRGLPIGEWLVVADATITTWLCCYWRWHL